MSVAACAALVERGDPDRARVTRLAPEAAQARLWPLYAYNLEIARAPWITREPMIAEIRLQWWRDALAEIAAGAPPRRHEVVLPLAAAITSAGLPVALLDAMAEARRWDIAGEGFADAAALFAYLDATAGHLMWLAALALGAGPEAEPAVRDAAAAAGLAAWLQAVAALSAAGRRPLPEPSESGVAALARAGLDRLAAARSRRASVPGAALPALLTGWQSGPLLRRAAVGPGRVLSGTLALPEAARRGRLAWAALSGRW